MLTAVFAHSGRGDLPFPTWMLLYGAAAGLAITALALRMAWPRPRLSRFAEGRRLRLPRDGSRAVRSGLTALVGLIGLVLFAGVVVVAFWGDPSPAVNLAPLTVSILFWSGGVVASALVGDVWPAASPFWTIARLLDRLDRRPGSDADRAGRWSAPVMLAGFAWLTLAYHDPSSPRAVGVALVIYAVAALAGSRRWGSRWLRYGEGFAALFAAVGSAAPLVRAGPSTVPAEPGSADLERRERRERRERPQRPERRERRERAELRIRPPLSGLGHPAWERDDRFGPATTAVLLLVVGASMFDGVAGAGWWLDVVGGRSGWALTGVATIGLAWTVGLVGLVFHGMARLAARSTRHPVADLVRLETPPLVPLAVALTIAHSFDLLVVEAQNFVALASDPLGRGWNLFGTIANTPELIPSPTTTAVVQAVALLGGGLAALVVAHERAVSSLSPARAARADRCMLVFVSALILAALALLVES